jgi:hypothetical protein
MGHPTRISPEIEKRTDLDDAMPTAWRVIAWSFGLVIALASAIYVRSLGFDWLKVVIALLGTWLLSSSIISHYCAALALRNVSKNVPKVADYIERLEKQTPQILKEKLHAAFPRCVIDISWLPADKQRIVEVIKFAWLTAKDDKTRARLEGDWMFLSQFQYGVGATPIQVFSRTSAKISRWPSKEQKRWFRIVSTESKFLARECEQFKQTQIRPSAL